ncbi:MAG: hypothetical protein ACI8S6_004579 [Myxococcota bacterium]|jgi:hypothetical protein
MLMLWVLLGCDRSPHADGLFAGCTDADCEIARAEAGWASDPAGVAAAVATHPVVEARIAIASALIAAHPGETAGLCAALPPGDAQDRCTQLSERPHLWQETRQATPTVARPGGGPSSNEVAPVTPITTALSEQPPAPHGCADAPDRSGCLTAAAQAAAAQRQTAAAAGQCVNILDDRWRGECFFQAAEAVLSSRGAHGYGDAVELCAAAEPFAQNCHSHALMLLAEAAPAADHVDPRVWQPVQLAAQSIRTAWSWRDPYMAEIAEDRLWSEAIGRAYAGAHSVTGDPLDVLPERAHRHVRAAAVQALVAKEGASAHSLSGWVEHAEQALARRSTHRPQRGAAPFRSAPELWPLDRAGEETIPATAYLGTARRTYADDPRADLAICVLEAIARTPPVNTALLAEGVGHPEPGVQWTAKRLGELRSPPGG